MIPNTVTLQIEQLKSFVTILLAGYPFLATLIWYLIKELVKSKDDENELLKEIIPLSSKLTEVCNSMNIALSAIINNKNKNGGNGV